MVFSLPSPHDAAANRCLSNQVLVRRCLGLAAVMEGASSFARLDSRGWLSPHEHLRNSVTLSVFLLRWAQVFVERKFEIHQLGAFGIGNAGDVDVGAGE